MKNKKKFSITNEIKKHEKKYTIITVIFFIFLILFTGYLILSIDNKELNINKKSINYRYSSLSTSFQKITLTNKNIMSNSEGLKSNKIPIHIENNTNTKYDYKIVLKKDKETTNICGCENNIEDYKYIRYSLNGKDVLKLDKNMIIYKKNIKEEETQDILINIWIDKDILNINNNYHYHGYFSIERINQD